MDEKRTLGKELELEKLRGWRAKEQSGPKMGTIRQAVWSETSLHPLEKARGSCSSGRISLKSE